MNDLHAMPDPTGKDVVEVGNAPEHDGAITTRDHLVRADATKEVAQSDIPDGFELRDDGIYILSVAPDGDAGPARLCSPLIVQGRCSASNGGDWGRVVDVTDPLGRVHRLILDEADLYGAPLMLLKPLLSKGFRLGPVEKAAQRVAQLLQNWVPEQDFVRVRKLGWTSGEFSSFALANGGVIGEEKVVIDIAETDLSQAMVSRGEAAVWRDTVATKCIGNPLMVLAVSQAFSGPLLEPLAMEGGGFHLRGLSGRGKSTVAMVAASVWGSPAFFRTWRATDNGLEIAAATCSGALMVLDEMKEAAPRAVGAAVYMLANGQAKQRMQQPSRAGTAQRWHVSLISTGEISVSECLADAGERSHAGQEVRLIDVVADNRTFGSFDNLHGESNLRAFASKLKRVTADTYGTAGPAFVKSLAKRGPSLRDLLQGQLEKMHRLLGKDLDLPDDGQIQRVLGRFALVALAGELATKVGLTGWTGGTALSAAREIFKRWLEDRDCPTRSEIALAIERMRDYLAKNIAQFTTTNDTVKMAVDGWRDEQWFYVRSDCWARIHGSLESQTVAKHLHAAGLLRTGSGSGFQHRMPRSFAGRPRVYAVKAEILQVEARGAA